MRLSDILLELYLQYVTCFKFMDYKKKKECQQRCIHFLRISYLSIGSHFQGQSNINACGYNLHIGVTSCAGYKEK